MDRKRDIRTTCGMCCYNGRMPEGIPKHVERLIASYITSVEELEVLLLLRRHPDRTWQPEEVGRELATPAESAEVRLKDLVSDGFLERKDGYRYTPKTPDLRKAVEDLAETYGKRRVTVIGLIFAKPSDAVQSFADAFKLKED